MKKEKLAEIDRVHFTDFGDFSLNYEVIFYMLDKDYTKYRNTQQSINLALKKKFEEEEIDFAYPTQLIYTQQS
jgi:small-conductance mechanosensitive channel